MKNRRIYTLGILLALIAVAVIGRAVPHLPNFTPLAAAGLFAGFLFRSRLLALTVPLGALLLSDLFFAGGYDFRVMAIVWVALSVPALLGPWLRKDVKASSPAKARLFKGVKIFFAAGTGSILFFVASNLATFFFGGLYALTFEGLGACFTAALPFLRYTMAGDLMYAGGFFGLYALITLAQRAYQNRLAVS